MKLSYLAQVLCSFLLWRNLLLSLEFFAYMLEFVNVVVGADFPEHLNVKGGDLVVEFMLIWYWRTVKLLESTQLQVGESEVLVAGRRYDKV